MLASFGLQILKKSMKQIDWSAHKERIDPFCPLFLNCLKISNNTMIVTTIHILLSVMKM